MKNVLKIVVFSLLAYLNLFVLNSLGFNFFNFIGFVFSFVVVIVELVELVFFRGSDGL